LIYRHIVRLDGLALLRAGIALLEQRFYHRQGYPHLFRSGEKEKFSGDHQEPYGDNTH
jgi:hypothetical protein